MSDAERQQRTGITASLAMVWVLGGVVFLLALSQAWTEAGRFCVVTLPFLCQALAAGGVALVGLLYRRWGYRCVLVGAALLALLPVPAIFGANRWPGGAEEAVGWGVLAGLGSVVCLFFGVVVFVLAVAYFAPRG